MKPVNKFQRTPVMKRIVSLLTAVFMILTMTPIPVQTAQAADTVTVKAHFQNTGNWSNVYAHYWERTESTNSDTAWTSWPGNLMSEDSDNPGYYTVVLTGVNTSKALGFVFNNGSGTQTGDLMISSSTLQAETDGELDVWADASSSAFSLTAPAEAIVSPEVNGTTVTFRYYGPDAGSAVLFGSMNSWASSYEMSKGTDGVWSCTLELEPGTYEYKFVVDGNWLTDPLNTEYANGNSVVVVEENAELVSPEVNGTTVTFRYYGPDAGNAVLFGSMNSWASSYEMSKGTDGVWSCTLELEPGTYEYKFVVDGNWLTDPLNSNYANGNSVFTVTEEKTVISPEIDGTTVTFRYVSESAAKVEVFGSMNGWASGYEMTKDSDGVWSYTIELSAGTYEYKFVVNGSEWVTDPLNTEYANGNSAFTVVGGDETPQLVTIRAYFQNTSNWSNVYGYVWTNSGTTLLGNWPGTQLSKQDGYYVIEITDFDASSDFNFIFNNGNGGSGNQTADLKVSSAVLKADEDQFVEVWANGDSETSLTGPVIGEIVPGLKGMNVAGVRGEVIELPSTLKYVAEDGTESKKEVNYTLNTEDALVQIDNTDKTVTVPADYAGDELVLTAATEEGYTATVKVLLSDELNYTITIKLHYSRTDGNYTDWNVWMWAEGKDGAQYDFAEEDGEMVATYVVENGLLTNKVGFIVRKGEWKEQEGGDRFVDLSNVVSGTVHCYVVSGQTSFDQDESEAANGIKIVLAEYDRGTNKITVTASNDIDDAETAFTLRRSDGTEIVITGVESIGDSQYVLSIDADLTSMEALFKSYILTYDGNDYKVAMPNVYSSEEFENAYTYTGDDLGAVWTEGETTFKVWAPTADKVELKLYKSGTVGEDETLGIYSMTADENGVWTVTVEGNLNGVYYTYLAEVNGSVNEACDPYARTTGVNGLRAMVIDLDSTDPEGWEYDESPNKGMSYNDAIIYELHIRDLSADSSSGIENVGKFLGLTETGTTTESGQSTGLDHIVDLGVTHLHLLPVYDYASVDETKLDEEQYNWGYDPLNYNVPEGSYSTDPYNGEVRVKEMKQMVQTLHENGINVIMDVVYNHVYNAGSFCFNQIVPDYFSRTDSLGNYSNGSGCGNDTASEREMVKKYIVDSVTYWADEYHIDGFRFDLVGLIDTETINEVVAEVHKTHPDVIFYGEGWTMGTAVTKDGYTMTTQLNSTETPDFAFFSDTIRDLLKGGNDASSLGFVSGASGKESDLIKCFTAATSWCKSPSQTVNYASCHDNYTLKDKLNLSVSGASEEDRIKMNNLAAAIYMTSEGIPFIHAGEEILRTKVDETGEVIHNSYNSSDYVNAIQWSDLDNEAYQNVRDYYKGLIEFRKNHASLRLTTAAEISEAVKSYTVGSNLVMFVIDGTCVEDEVSEQIVVIFNANNVEKNVSLYNYGVSEGQWQICVDDEKAGIEVLGTVTDGMVTVSPISALILVLGETEDTDSVYTQNARIPVEAVTLDKENLELTVDETAELTATVTPDDATSQNVSWSSSDETVATVDENGVVTAVGEGTAVITATAGTKSASCTVTVTKPEPGTVENATDSEGNDYSGTLEETGEELADKVLTEEDLQRVEQGESVRVYLVVTDITDSVSAQEKALAEAQMGEAVTGMYMDIALYKQVGDDEPVKITKVDDLLTISITVPGELINTDSSVTRTYQLIRINNGVAETIEVSFDPETGVLSFETDVFSTFVLAYSDVKQDTGNTGGGNNGSGSTGDNSGSSAGSGSDSEAGVDTGDTAVLWIWVGLMAVSGLAVVLVEKKKAFR